MTISGGSQALLFLKAQTSCDIDFVECNLMEGKNKTPEFLAMNPLHCIPTLTDEETGVVMWETNAIMRYICQKYSLESVYPSDLKQRAECEVMLDMKLSIAVKNLGYGLLYPVVGFAPETTVEAENACEEVWKNDAWPAMKKYLGDSPFLGGGSPSIADISIFSYCNLVYIVRPGLSIFTEEACPGFKGWIEAMRAQPGYAGISGPECVGFYEGKAT